MRYSLLFILLLVAGSLRAQSYKDRINPEVEIGDSTQVHQVILRDYTRLRGVITDVRSDSIFIRVATIGDTITVPTYQMRHVGLYRPERYTRFANPRGQDNLPDLYDLTFVRTALPYSRKNRFKTVMLVYNVFEWNLNDHFQLGAGLAGPLGFLFTQRYRTSLTPYFHLGFSNQLLMVPLAAIGNSGFPAVGDATTLLTVGEASQFLTLGTGLFYSLEDGGVALHNYRVGMGVRVSRKVHLYGEMLGFKDGLDDFVLLPSLNAAVAGGKHRWSFGLLSVFFDGESNVFVPIPYISYSLYN